MKYTHVRLLICTVILVSGLWPLAPVFAACTVQNQRVAAVVSDVVAVPVAVPVGVPVASYSPYYYSYQGAAQTSPAYDVDAIAAAVAKRLKDEGDARKEKLSMPPMPDDSSTEHRPSSVVIAKCARCHSQGSATSKAAAFEAFNPAAALNCEQRLAAARTVLSEKMPKGAKLSADEAGQVLTELIGK